MKSLAEWMTKLSKKNGYYSMAVINKKSGKFIGLLKTEEVKAKNRRYSSKDEKEE